MKKISSEEFNNKYGQNGFTPVTPKQSFFKETLGDIKETGRAVTGSIYGAGKNIFDTLQKPEEQRNSVARGFDVAGDVVGGVTKAFGDVGVGAGKVALSQQAEDKVADTVRNTLAPIAQSPEVQDFITKYQGLDENEKQNLRTAGNLGIALVDILTLKGASIGIRGVRSGLDKISKIEIPTDGLKKIVEATKKGYNPESIMQRVARISKGKQAKFEQTSGQSVGKYLVERGIYGNIDEISEQLYKRFTTSKGVADEALSKIDGLYEPEVVKTALSELVEREIRVSAKGALSPNINRVKELLSKLEKQGLSMTEINEVKRLYEKNVKLDFLKSNLPESVARANNIDNAIREWQFNQADTMGLKNLPDINKETRLSRQLLNDIGKEYSGSAGNNAITLTDWVLLSGGDPTAIGGFLAKKIFSAKGVQSKFAKKLAGEETKKIPSADFKFPFGQQPRLGAGGVSGTSSNNVPIILPEKITNNLLGNEEIKNAVINRMSLIDDMNKIEDELFNKIRSKVGKKLTPEEEKLLNELIKD